MYRLLVALLLISLFSFDGVTFALIPSLFLFQHFQPLGSQRVLILTPLAFADHFLTVSMNRIILGVSPAFVVLFTTLSA